MPEQWARPVAALRRQQVAILHRAGHHAARVHPQHKPAALTEQPEAPAGGQLRPRPQGACARVRPVGETPTDQYLLPSPLPKHARVPPQGPRPAHGARARQGPPARSARLSCTRSTCRVRSPGRSPEAESEGDRARTRGQGVSADSSSKDRDAGGAVGLGQSPYSVPSRPRLPERDRLRLLRSQIRPAARSRIEAQRGGALPCLRRA